MVKSDENLNNFYDQIFNSRNTDININLGGLLKIPLLAVLIGVVLYAFLLVLRVRILVDTVDTTGNINMKMLAYINLAIALVGALIGSILIILG